MSEFKIKIVEVLVCIGIFSLLTIIYKNYMTFDKSITLTVIVTLLTSIIYLMVPIVVLKTSSKFFKK